MDPFILDDLLRRVALGGATAGDARFLDDVFRNQHGWIPVEQALPAPLEDVLLAHVDADGEPVVDMGFRRDDGTWLLSAVNHYFVHPTAWQPIARHPLVKHALREDA